MKSTVSAIATPAGAGGIGIVRLSGPESIEIAKKVFRASGNRDISEMPGYSAAFGHIIEADGSSVDQAICIIYRAPRSYTGEDVIELQCHGGSYLIGKVLRLTLAAGAEPAGPGEFTKRAFLNGKVDLDQAEAVMNIIGAHGEQAANAAFNALEGNLSRAIREKADTLIAASAHMAAWADYPEEDVEELDFDVLLTQFRELVASLEEMRSRFDAGQAVTVGVDTAIVGRPNVGKSTLMNLLLGRNRSIVTSVAGTTRDVIEETARIGNVVLRLSDTAGIHESDDLVESIGIEMAEKKLKHANLVLAVFDVNEPLEGSDIAILEACREKHSVAIVNKTDLAEGKTVEAFLGQVKPYVSRAVAISAKETDCYEAVKEVLEDLLGTADFDPSAAMLANERQLACCNSAISCIKEAIEAIETGMTMDAVNVCVDSALEQLFALTGEKVSDTVIDEVFARFCVGK